METDDKEEEEVEVKQEDDAVFAKYEQAIKERRIDIVGLDLSNVNQVFQVLGITEQSEREALLRKFKDIQAKAKGRRK